MSTTQHLTNEEADHQVDDLLEAWQRASNKDRPAVERQINAIIQFCSPTMQNHAWSVTHPDAP